MQDTYQPEQIEKQVQQLWNEQDSFAAIEDLSKEKFFCLSMCPYPSGNLHIGHVRNYTLGDVISRYQRMLGKNVLQPMAWDAFGLPAENAAIKNNIAPAKWTYANIDVMRAQFKRLGFAYDWKRELTTCNPEYYRWEQWFFIQLYKKGLVYKKNAVVNWDPVDQTILANEQVINGRGWRSGAIVERKEIPQWFLKITAYADELLNDIEKLTHWPEEVRTMQRNWIGRSIGANIFFPVVDSDDTIEVFTTRADTLMGSTYLAIAPQHALAIKAAENNADIKHFLEECANLPVAEAALATMEKRGMFSGFYATHPLTHKEIPIWIANFVVADYGTGAVMSVPAHDQRDFEFAQKYHLPIVQVIKPNTKTEHDFSASALTDYGTLINSANFDGLTSEEALSAITTALEKINKGNQVVHFRLRDWSVSRQRYWGTPIPMIHCDKCGTVPVAEKDLPVILPEDVHFEGATSPLKHLPEFYNTTCPTCGEPAKRETETFDTFVESSWYYARFASYNQNKSMLDDRAKYWTPVDQYVGGIEHAVMHLLYARFFHKLLRDEGLLNSDEPFTRLLTQGMVLKDGVKMSKSKGNTVDPNELIDKYGADTVRLFIIFAAPPEQSLEWSDSGVEGAFRYLKRLWAFVANNQSWILEINKKYEGDVTPALNSVELPAELKTARRQIYEILELARYDFERQQFNTVVSGCMKLLNLLQELSTNLNPNNQELKYIIFEGTHILIRLLAPIVPHIAQAMWHHLGFPELIIHAKWPKVLADALQSDTKELVVQINGKLKGHITVPSNADQKAVQEITLKDPHIYRALDGRAIKKIIVVPNRIVNIVV